MLTYEQMAELHRLLHEYSMAEYHAGFYNAQAYMRAEATEKDKARCHKACMEANAAEEKLMSYMGGLMPINFAGPK